MTQLVLYDTARAALAECRSIDEVKDIRDKAEAMRAYGRMASDRQLEVDAFEVRHRAEYRMGELLIAAKSAGQLSVGGRPRKATGRSFDKMILREIGIDKKMSSRAQRAARIAPGTFDRLLADARIRALNDRKLKPTLNLPKSTRTSHTKDIATSFRIDLRALPLGLVRRIIEHCGAASDAETIGTCVSDAKLRALLNGARR